VTNVSNATNLNFIEFPDAISNRGSVKQAQFANGVFFPKDVKTWTETHVRMILAASAGAGQT
jgi:hypothetical protein